MDVCRAMVLGKCVPVCLRTGGPRVPWTLIRGTTWNENFLETPRVGLEEGAKAQPLSVRHFGGA